MNDIKRVLKDSKRFILGIIILLFFAWGLSGIYSISHEEAGVVTVFGRVSDKIVEPGELDPEQITVPGVFITTIVQAKKEDTVQKVWN